MIFIGVTNSSESYDLNNKKIMMAIEILYKSILSTR
jgi:hypothetical protein